jgi:hypothetical protein
VLKAKASEVPFADSYLEMDAVTADVMTTLTTTNNLIENAIAEAEAEEKRPNHG